MSQQTAVAGSELTLRPGTIVAGRYEVVRMLGTGSMGTVYACRHRELVGHQVAMKVLYPEVAADKLAMQRFRNEIYASYRVAHPNVVRAHEYLRDGSLVAYTMEYVNGSDLAEHLSSPERLPSIESCLQILRQVTAGVGAIHAAGIVHRDIKPENILLTKDGQVKISDFGIARLGKETRVTEHGGIVGTIDYLAPEYLLNTQLDERSDIYAIGVLGFELVAGTPPYRAGSVVATLRQRLEGHVPSITEHRADCPPELSELIQKAMARQPEQRFQTAAEMEEALVELSRKLWPEKEVPGFGHGGEHAESVMEDLEKEEANLKKNPRPTSTVRLEELQAELQAKHIPGYRRNFILGLIAAVLVGLIVGVLAQRALTGEAPAHQERAVMSADSTVQLFGRFDDSSGSI